MMWNHHGRYAGMNDSMGSWGIWLVLIALLVGLVVVCVGVGVGLTVRARARRAADAPGPTRILAESYARGEIGDEEYARRLRVLRSP
jgi:putative membrane protein